AASSRARYIAIWRGTASRAERADDTMSSTDSLKWSATAACIVEMVGLVLAGERGWMTPRTADASSQSIGLAVRELDATIRTSAPSSARTLLVTRVATRSSTSGSANAMW